MSLRERTRPNWSRKLLNTWRHVSKQLAEAANSGDINDVVIALRLVLQLENVPCLPQ